MVEKYITKSEFDTALEQLCKKYNISYGGESMGFGRELAELSDRLTAANVVTKSAYDQARWERDLAISQLEELGLSLGEKADRKVQRIVHGQWERTSSMSLFDKHYVFYHCTACGRGVKSEDEIEFEYCPFCGAKMKEKEDIQK